MPGKGSYYFIILLLYIYIIIESLTIYPIYLILLYSNSTSTLLQQTSLHLVQFEFRFIL
jgi:hypothetical protein